MPEYVPRPYAGARGKSSIAAQFPQFPVATDYRDLRNSIDGAVAALKAARKVS